MTTVNETTLDIKSFALDVQIELGPSLASDLLKIFKNHAKKLIEATPNTSLMQSVKAMEDGDDLALFDLITGLHGSELAALSTSERYAIVRKLGKRPENIDDVIRNRREFTATLVLATQPYPEEYERFEARWAEALQHMPFYKDIKKIWADRKDTEMSLSDFLTHAWRLSAAQIAAFQKLTNFDWVPMPSKLITFNLSRAEFDKMNVDLDSEDDTYPDGIYFNYTPENGTDPLCPHVKNIITGTIAYNRHADAGKFSADALVHRTTHEIAHLVVYKWMAEAEGSQRQKIYASVLKALNIEHFMGDFLDSNFRTPVYRSTMNERLAFGFSEKVTDIFKGNSPKKEQDYLLDFLIKSRPHWEKALRQRFDEISQSRPVWLPIQHATAPQLRHSIFN